MSRKLIATFVVALVAGLASGCAREPAKDTRVPGPGASSTPAPMVPLAGAEWRVVDIARTPVVENSSVTLTFGADGRVSGNSTCNSFSGPYEASGDSLHIGPTMGTLRACVETSLMEQETRFLAVLGEVRAYTITPDTSLVLRTADGRTITARRG